MESCTKFFAIKYFNYKFSNFIKFGQLFVSEDFPEMKHGWVTRGDQTQPEVLRDINKALEMTI